jgi:hypothetical protein
MSLRYNSLECIFSDFIYKQSFFFQVHWITDVSAS